MAELNYDCDAIICSGGIAENDPEIFGKIFTNFDASGVYVKNPYEIEEGDIPVIVLPANEELAMAKAVLER